MAQPTAPPQPQPQPQPLGTQNQAAVAASPLVRRLFEILFYAQLILVVILTIVLTVRGLLSAKSHNFHPVNWYPPLLTAVACAGIAGFSWHLYIVKNPARAVKAAFWLSPLLTCAFGVLLVTIESSVGLAFGIVAIISGLIQSLYGCWVNHRFEYAGRILWVSTVFPPTHTTVLVGLSIVVSVAYSGFLVCGIGGATATATTWDIVFIFIILLHFTWTMHVIKNLLQATIARVKYMNFGYGANVDTRVASHDTMKYLIGSVSMGSAMVPIIGTVRGSARALSSIGGGSDEFLFSCTDCYSGIALTLITHGNRWGFVHVGALNKGFVQASRDAWENFNRAGLQHLIDSDLTGVFCFFCGLTGGAISALAGGTWALAVQKGYATEVSLYAFLIGYFMSRISVAWAQASVSAYYVAYAENPNNDRFDSTIPSRLEAMRRYGH
ncbi:hypothetical protein NL676_001495 [Syzygium grande]|nr:hypothetical protein NL676_001495 [Syzygium grande]